ncbi:unnamed protein product, partial [Staurois parvus]
CKCRFLAALSSRCQIVRKVLPKTGSCQSGDQHRSSGSLITSALMIGAQQCHTQVPPTCAQQCTHLCPAMHPPVSPPVPSSATHLCPPTCAHQCHPPCAHQCSPAVLPVSATSQCQRLCQSVPPVSAQQ